MRISFQPSIKITVKITSSFVIFVLILYAFAILRGDFPTIYKRFSDMPIFSGIVEQRQKVKTLARQSELSFIAPNFPELIKEAIRRDLSGKRFSDNFISYYEQAVESFPDDPGLFNIMGYVYDNHGLTEESIAAYKKAIELSPKYFWPNYNLGTFYYKQADYEAAVEPLRQAAPYNRRIILSSLYTSPFYQELFRATRNLQIDLLRTSLTDAVRNAYIMLIVSLHETGKYQDMLNYAQYALKARLQPTTLFQYYSGVALKKIGYKSEAKGFFADVPKDIIDSDDLYVWGEEQFVLKIF